LRAWPWAGNHAIAEPLGHFDVHVRLLAHLSASMLNQLTISELVSKLATREVSSRAAIQACLAQIRRVDPQIRAFISYDAADALAQAEAADAALASGVTHRQRPL